MLSVQIKISGDRELISKLKKLGPSFLDFRQSMNHIGHDVSQYYANVVFASQGGVLGHKWARLNPSYAAWKGKHYLGNRGTLIATGEMQHGFTHEETSNSVTITNKMPYFKYHQSSAPRKHSVGGGVIFSDTLGDAVRHSKNGVNTSAYGIKRGVYTKKGSGGLPYRPMMGINTAVKGIIQETINADVTSKIKRAGL